MTKAVSGVLYILRMTTAANFSRRKLKIFIHQSPHMVVKYNKKTVMEQSTKKKYSGNAMSILVQQSTLWPDHVKSTQQCLCINFVRRRSSGTLGM